jgi:hypothetical protein
VFASEAKLACVEAEVGIELIVMIGTPFDQSKMTALYE